MPRTAFADLRIGKAKPQGAPCKFDDTPGLFGPVMPNGSKPWRQKCTRQGRQRLLTHDAYPQVSLASARRKRDDARICLGVEG